MRRADLDKTTSIVDRKTLVAIEGLGVDSSLRRLQPALQRTIFALLASSFVLCESAPAVSGPLQKLLANLHAASEQASELAEAAESLLAAPLIASLPNSKSFRTLPNELRLFGEFTGGLSKLVGKPRQVDERMRTELLVRASLLTRHATGSFGDAELADFAQTLYKTSEVADFSESAIKGRRERLKRDHLDRYKTLDAWAKRLHSKLNKG